MKVASTHIWNSLQQVFSSERNEIGVFIVIALFAVMVAMQPVVMAVLASSVLVVWFAHRFVGATLILVVLLGQIAQFESSEIFFGQAFEGIQWRGVTLRLSDPLLFGIIASLCLRFFQRNGQGIWTFFKRTKLFVFFVLYLLVEVLRNIGVYGFNSLGEFRTYYQFFLFVPYIVLATQTAEQRLRIFKILLTLSLLHLVLGPLKGGLMYEFRFDAYQKWLTGFGSLSLLYGMFGVFIAKREALLKISSWAEYSIYIVGSILIILSSTRSVWLAGAVGVVFLFLSGRLTFSKQMRVVIAIPLVLLLLIPVFSYSGIELGEFLEVRLAAFTDFESDPTALWRYNFWVQTVEEFQKNLWFGSGFGKHFEIYIPEYNRVISTSPHNLYLAILYELGVVGLALYLMFVIPLGVRLFRSTKQYLTSDRAILSLSVLVLLTVHFYGIAYTFEKNFLIWPYIALGLSAYLYAEENRSHAATVR